LSYRKKHIKPYLRKLKPKKPFFKKTVFWISLILTIILIFAYFLIFSWFQVSKIDITGNDKVNSQDIKNTVISNAKKDLFSLGPINFYSSSILLINKKKLLSSIINTFPDIKRVIVNKKFPDTVNVSVVERSQYAVFCEENNNCFSIDDDGIIFADFKGDIANNLILQKNLNSQMINFGQNVIEKDIIDKIKKINQNLQDNFQIGVNKVIISNYLQFKTSEGWSVYFDPATDIKTQISEINALLKSEISEEKRKNLQYIYLQYKGRAYYK